MFEVGWKNTTDAEDASDARGVLIARYAYFRRLLRLRGKRASDRFQDLQAG